MQAGLGGGSSDAAAALRALAKRWRVGRRDGARRRPRRSAPTCRISSRAARRSASSAAICCFRCSIAPPAWVVLVLPGLRRQHEGRVRVVRRAMGARGSAAPQAPADRLDRARGSELVNDLEAPVAGAASGDRPDRFARFERAGASQAAMSGSGSAVFGLFSDAASGRGCARPRRRARRPVDRREPLVDQDCLKPSDRLPMTLAAKLSPSDTLTVCAAWFGPLLRSASSIDVRGRRRRGKL